MNQERCNEEQAAGEQARAWRPVSPCAAGNYEVIKRREWRRPWKTWKRLWRAWCERKGVCFHSYGINIYRDSTTAFYCETMREIYDGINAHEQRYGYKTNVKY